MAVTFDNILKGRFFSGGIFAANKIYYNGESISRTIACATIFVLSEFHVRPPDLIRSDRDPSIVIA